MPLISDTTPDAECLKSLVMMVVKDYMPFQTVDSPFFRDLLRLLSPNIHIPSRKTLVKQIDNLFESAKNHLTKALRSKSLSLTTDCWTDAQNSSSYLALTGHFVHEDKLESAILGVCDFRSSHTSTALYEKIQDI